MVADNPDIPCPDGLGFMGGECPAGTHTGYKPQLHAVYIFLMIFFSSPFYGVYISYTV